jgi:hypothetical protein
MFGGLYARKQMAIECRILLGVIEQILHSMYNSIVMADVSHLGELQPKQHPTTAYPRSHDPV